MKQLSHQAILIQKTKRKEGSVCSSLLLIFFFFSSVVDLYITNVIINPKP
ncbi:hypothetical protein [Vibrio phage vB_pir03]|nr:hypothetical protein [Vibrio phage vB_pir03]